MEKHVKSHQNNNTNSLGSFSLPAWLNIVVEVATPKAYKDCPLCQVHFFTLHSSGISCHMLLYHIHSTFNYLFGLLQIYHISFLQRKAPLMRRNHSLNRLDSLRQRVQTALHKRQKSVIEAPKWTVAILSCSSQVQSGSVSHLSKVLFQS